MPLKDPAQFRLIGREGAVKKLDSAAKTNGTAQFTIDIREPGMLTVVVARPPRFGGKVARFDAGEARAVPGVVDVKEIPSGVAVYADGMWPALKGREKLRITWDESAAEKRSSEQLVDEYRALARKPGMVAGQHGDAEAALAARRAGDRGGVRVSVSRARADGAARRLPALGRRAGAGAVRQPAADRRSSDHRRRARPQAGAGAVETMLAGGSFGRRAQPNMHLAAELAQAAKAIGPGRR